MFLVGHVVNDAGFRLVITTAGNRWCRHLVPRRLGLLRPICGHVFSLVSPALTVVCELANWPLFSYHPARPNIDLGLAPPIKGRARSCAVWLDRPRH